jgi:tetratricopeptide (TPR) repeat protein
MTARDLGNTAVDDSNVGWAYYNAGADAKTKNDDAAAQANYELSKAFLQKAVEKDPKLDAAYMNLGSTYNGLGEYQLAVNVLNTALGLRPDWVLALNQLGVGYRGAGDLAAAITQFTRATTIDSVNVYGLFNLGSTQYAAGDKNGAKKTQSRLNKINPALGSQLGNILAGKVINQAQQEIKKKIPVRIPY